MQTSPKSFGHRKASVQDLIDDWFPPAGHPYRTLERCLHDHLGSQATVLEIGCGRTAPLLRQLKGKAEILKGVDVVDFTIDDPDIQLLNNDAADMNDVADDSVDFAFSRSVMEHVSDIHCCYRELYRILKPGGTYLFLTPNFWDYGSLISYLIPNQFHQTIVSRTEGRAEENTFPAFYRSNTQRSIRRLARTHGFDIKDFNYLGQYPAYLAFNRSLFVLGSKYEKLLTRHVALHWLRGWILCAIRKPG